jgi:S-adenosylmethionine:tRNA ribosyltransferase-isomerase
VRAVRARPTSCRSTFRRQRSATSDARDAAVDLGRTGAYHYDLPPELIAKTPVDPADSARLLVLRADGTLEHRRFVEFPELLAADDLLAINETRVIRARLRGRRVPGGGAAEVLLLRPLDHARYAPEARRWEALVRPGRRLREGARIIFGEAGEARVVGVTAEGLREIEFDLRVPFETLLADFGELPLPPYVGPGDAARAARYQTPFARVPGSVAAPTASLHFTPRVLDGLKARGVELVPVELDVGYGTFKPIEAERLDAHVMHAETYAISEASALALTRAKRDGRRIVAAGTTTLRALESAAIDRTGAGEGVTSLFIRPGFRFRVADVLLTNFHLPGSSLLVLVAAFAGYERMRRAYAEAVAREYRFFSFGDAMLIEREARSEPELPGH